MPGEFLIDIDLSAARRSAREARDLLNELRGRHDLSRWEYTRAVRIAPTEISHSHPVLTLNGRFAHRRNRDPDSFLSEYLHEQVHWALDLHRDAESRRAIDELIMFYPEAPVAPPDAAKDRHSTYLHLVVNWLEIEATSEFIGRERAEAVARRASYYRWMYRTVLADRAQIEAILTTTGVLPLPPAN